MGLQLKPVEEKSLLSTTTFSAGGCRAAYDLEKQLYLPAPPETLFDLRRDNAPYFVKEFGDLFEGDDKSLQIFNREKVGSETRSRISNTLKYAELTSRYGWTPFRQYARLDSIKLNEDETAVTIKLKDTERIGGEEMNIEFNSMSKLAFLRRKFPENINMEEVKGLYLSVGSSFRYRHEYVYVLKDEE